MKKNYLFETYLKTENFLRNSGISNSENIIMQLFLIKQLAEKDYNTNYYEFYTQSKDLHPDIFDFELYNNYLRENFNAVFDALKNTNLSKASLDEKFEVAINLIQRASVKYDVPSPINLVKSIISDLALTPEQKIFDSEAKSGEILLYIIKYLLEKYPNKAEQIFKNVSGSEYSDENIKRIKLASLFIFGREINISPEKFIDSNKNNKYDIAITNPRFGKSNFDRKSIERYKLAYKWIKTNQGVWEKTGNLKNNLAEEILQLEKLFSELEPNGTLTIILPNAILENDSYEYIRAWIKNNAKIERITSLYVGIFKPSTNVKTSVMVLKKKTNNFNDYNLKLSIIKDEAELMPNLFKNNYFKIPISSLSTDNFAPEYYKTEDDDIVKLLEMNNCSAIKEISTILSTKSSVFKGIEEKIRYIDISSVDSLTGEIKEVKIYDIKDAPKRAYYEVQAGDVITAVSGGSIGTKSHTSAVITQEYSGCICSNGFKVLRLNNDINPYYLWYFFRSDYYLQQVKRVSVGSTIPNIRDKDFQSIKVLIPPLQIQEEIAQKVQDYLKLYKEAQAALYSTEKNIERLMKGELLLWK